MQWVHRQQRQSSTYNNMWILHTTLVCHEMGQVHDQPGFITFFLLESLSKCGGHKAATDVIKSESNICYWVRFCRKVEVLVFYKSIVKSNHMTMGCCKQLPRWPSLLSQSLDKGDNPLIRILNPGHKSPFWVGWNFEWSLNGPL